MKIVWQKLGHGGLFPHADIGFDNSEIKPLVVAMLLAIKSLVVLSGYVII